MNNEWLNEAADRIAGCHRIAEDNVMRGWRIDDVKAEEWKELADELTAKVWGKYERRIWGRGR